MTLDKYLPKIINKQMFNCSMYTERWQIVSVFSLSSD